MAGEKRIVMQVYCRIEVVVDDPIALGEQAAQALREADVDWSEEQDTPDEAVAEIREDPSHALASLIEPGRMLEGVPGIEVRGGRWWAEMGARDERFNPGFSESALPSSRPASVVSGRVVER